MYHTRGSGGILSMPEVNALGDEEFAWLFDNVVEQNPDVAKHVAPKRPFASRRQLKRCFYEYLDNLDVDEKEEVLLNHSDILGQLLDGSLLYDTQYEQENIIFQAMSNEEKELLSTYNESYKEKFGIPFVTSTWENRNRAILTSIQARLQDTRENELQVAFTELKKLCKKRLNHLVWPDVMVSRRT
ncbi:2-oxo-4-hydroxy-4-carboxy-5-ureidoimidazoline decarboxylase-like [Ceratina calcarata]|uniref:2-oxo-4-hydroxy-4-carboxy-5-ureidoimidazoline decarboxylase n=1 Tax=Ceratina calcarata TaxID=156304 RepID=A0AAJ7W9F2_9HYME|nr:2-oxo-4-hydroxy-4-carboxy-5-ureidoimidazoline decarboxylase-like [Ceratina calcarata]